MRLNFIKASPSQNMTIFITNYVSPENYGRIANVIMGYEYLNAEQVGFIVPPTDKKSVLRLEMSGGEFCGNAVLSAAAYCYYKGLYDKKTFFLEASGTESPIICEIEVKDATRYEVKAEMPQPIGMWDTVLNIKQNRIPGSIVQLNGITHFLTEFWPCKNDFEPILEAVAEKIQDKALGVIPYKKFGEGKYEILPFVYVKSTGSKFFERACGSGTLALGINMAKKNNEYSLKVYQPGGMISVEIGAKNYISTNVRFTCEGYVDIDL